MMGIKRGIIGTVFIGLSAACFGWTSSENIVRLEGSVKGALTRTTAFKLSEQLRYFEEGFEYYYRHTEAALDWKFAENWKLTPTYRYVTLSKDGQSVSNPVYHLNLGNNLSVAGLDVKSRMRVMYADLPAGIGSWTDFRPKFTLQPSRGWTGWELKPYVADEVIINVDENRFYRNRVSLGMKLKPLSKLSIDGFVMQELTEGRENRWSERFNLGLYAGLVF